MGQQNSTLAPSELNHLVCNTHFKKAEILAWHRSFTRNHPAGKLTLAEFTQLYSRFFPYGDAAVFARLVFGVYDHSKSGAVDFRDLMMSLSINLRGNSDERLRWVFRFYDADNDGFISRDDLLSIGRALTSLVGRAPGARVSTQEPGTPQLTHYIHMRRFSVCLSNSSPSTHESAEAAAGRGAARRPSAIATTTLTGSNYTLTELERADFIMQLLDLDHDGKISPEEFRVSAKAHPGIF